MTLSKEIRAALDVDVAQESVRRVKKAVANELRLLNSNARVIDTQYFNHTFTPDFVIRWSGSGRVRVERPVYLRFDSEREFYAEDLDILGEDHPILLGLEVDPQGRSYPEEINGAALQKDAMVISSNAVEHLARRRPTDAFSRLVNASIGEAGRGAIDEQRAEATAEAALSSFSAARRTDAGELTEQLETVADVLSEAKASQLTSFLEAVWVGSGGVPTRFPRPLNLSGRLSKEHWQFLLDFEDVTDQAFWRGVGAGLDLEQLGSLTVETYSANLQALVASNWDRLSPRVARVVPDQARLDDMDTPGHYWSLAGGMLCLRGLESTLYVAVDKDALKVAPEKHDGPSVAQLLDRQSRTAFDVVEVLFAGQKRRIDFYADEGTLTPEEIAEKGGILGSAGRVKKASIRLSGDRKLALDFVTSTAGGLQSMHPLREIVIAAEGYLADATVDELREVSALLPDLQQQMLSGLPVGSQPSELPLSDDPGA